MYNPDMDSKINQQRQILPLDSMAVKTLKTQTRFLRVLEPYLYLAPATIILVLVFLAFIALLVVILALASIATVL